jgi:hypothetical protein
MIITYTLFNKYGHFKLFIEIIKLLNGKLGTKKLVSFNIVVVIFQLHCNIRFPYLEKRQQGKELDSVVACY